MKTINLLLVIVTATTLNLKFGTLNCKAQTSVPAGAVFGVWTLAGSPYNVQGNISIADATTLSIQPGVTVNFQGAFKLNVQGRLLAIGTAADTIIFTAVNTTNGWKGIRFDNTPITNDTSKITYCKVQYGKPTGGPPQSNGGAFYLYNFSKAIISNNKISNNSGTYGGGICCDYYSSPMIFNNTISYNIASSAGAGISCHYYSSPTISNNAISNNTSSYFGGGIYCFATSSPAISGNTISNNEAPFGGGIYCGIGNPTVINNTISNNNATNGGALYLEQAGNPIFRNCIIWGNSASASGGQVFLNDEASDPDFYYCNIDGDVAGFEVNGNSYTGTFQNNINTDPLFVSPSGGSGTGFNGVIADWSLQSSSPCIDSGDPIESYSLLDIAGNARVSVCRVDIGAYEYQNGAPFTATISQTQQILCWNDSTASATIIVTGGIPTYTYLWNNGQTNATITGLGAATYTVTVTETSYACSITKTITINEPAAALSLIPSTTNPICTNNNGIAGVIPSGGTSPYSYLWSTNNTTGTISGLLDGTYSVTVTDSNGCFISDSVTLVTQFPQLSVLDSITNASCTNNDGSISLIPNGDTAISYSYLWSTGSTNEYLSGIGSGTYSVTVTENTGCVTLDTFSIDNSIAPISIPICMVTVDSSSTKNVIVWEKPINALIDSFKVYREVSSVYSLVGSVQYNEVSEFTDDASGINPNTTSYKYKLSVLDTCGNESLLSDVHQSVHLQLSLAFPQGVNLSWNNYAGFSFSQYRILRDDLGNGNWQAIDSVSFGTTTYTSTDVLPNAGYIVEATRPTACISTRQSGTTRNSSKSNTALKQTIGVNELLNDLTVLISPNPSNGKFTLELWGLQLTNNKFAVKIYNVLGEQIYLSELKQPTKNEIDLSNVPEGIYFVNVYNEDKIYSRKIVKQ